MREASPLANWFAADRRSLFSRVEETVALILQSANASHGQARVRTLLSAVHGIVVLGIDRDPTAGEAAALDEELRTFVEVFFGGLRESPAARD